MRGRLPQALRRRSARPADPAEQPTGLGPAVPGASDAPTTVQPVAGDPALPAPVDGLPADRATPAEGPSFGDRGRFRRRLRYLRRVRELGFRDLGGLVFDLHRFGRQGPQLIDAKLTALAAVDRELRALERALDAREPYTELREPGIAACTRCGALHGTDARFCPSCGISLTGPVAVGPVADAVAPETAALTPPPAASQAAAGPSPSPTSSSPAPDPAPVYTPPAAPLPTPARLRDPDGSVHGPDGGRPGHPQDPAAPPTAVPYGERA